jgi:hypothetical protein
VRTAVSDDGDASIISVKRIIEIGAKLRLHLLFAVNVVRILLNPFT